MPPVCGLGGEDGEVGGCEVSLQLRAECLHREQGIFEEAISVTDLSLGDCSEPTATCAGERTDIELWRLIFA